jgi:hypothetical protein
MRTVVLSVMVFVSCARADDGQGAGAGAGAGRAVNAAPKGLAVAFGAPRLIAMSAYQSRALVVEAVYQATALSGAAMMGRIVNTGTIKVTAAGAQYLPQPTDRLVVDWGGQLHEFVVKNAQGNAMAATSDAWLASPHLLSYSHALDGQGKADVDVQFDGARFQVRARGTSQLGGEAVAFDLTATGAGDGARDYHGQDVTTTYAMTGSLKGDGYEVAVDEQQSARVVSATSLRVLPSMRGSASSVTTRISSVVRTGGAEIKFDGVQARSDLSEKGGNPRNQHHEVGGRVLRNGTPWGDCAMTAAGPVLKTRDGVVGLGLN